MHLTPVGFCSAYKTPKSSLPYAEQRLKEYAKAGDTAFDTWRVSAFARTKSVTSRISSALEDPT